MLSQLVRDLHSSLYSALDMGKGRELCTNKAMGSFLYTRRSRRLSTKRAVDRERRFEIVAITSHGCL